MRLKLTSLTVLFRIVYCCMKAWLPTRKIQIQSGNLLGKLTVESSSSTLSAGFSTMEKSKFDGKKLQN